MRASLGAILTHTTGRLLTTLDEAWPLQDYIVGHPLMTHARIMPENVVAADLLAQFPMLAEARPPADLVEGAPNREQAERLCRRWVESVASHVGFHEADVKSRAEVGA